MKDAAVTIADDRRVNWVSRSAEKLAGFIESVDVKKQELTMVGANCLDIGSSTGGFSQVLLEHGAAHIDAVDVGTDQLHVSLRDDPRISSYEQLDIRDFAKMSHKNYDILVCDASFISLENIIDSIIALSASHTIIILLYKPQFEVGRENLRKTGVPKDQTIVEMKMSGFESMLQEKNMRILIKTKATLIGEAGNQEWIYMIQKDHHLV